MNVYSEMRNKAKRQKTNHHQDSIIIGLLLPGVVLMLLAFMLLLYTISPHAGRSRTFYFRYALNVRNCAEFIRLDNFKLLVRAFASGCVPFSKELFFSSFSVFACANERCCSRLTGSHSFIFLISNRRSKPRHYLLMFIKIFHLYYNRL